MSMKLSEISFLIKSSSEISNNLPDISNNEDEPKNPYTYYNVQRKHEHVM